MDGTSEIKYYQDINKVDIYELEDYLIRIIKTNRRNMIYDSIILATWANNDSMHKISMALNDNLKLCFKLYKDDKYISNEYVDDENYKGCCKAFMKLLIKLKKIVKRHEELLKIENSLEAMGY